MKRTAAAAFRFATTVASAIALAGFLLMLFVLWGPPGLLRGPQGLDAGVPGDVPGDLERDATADTSHDDCN